MTWYNTLSIKLSNSQLNKLEPEIKNYIKVTLNHLSNVVRNSEMRLISHKWLLTNKQILKLRQTFMNKILIY